MRHSLWDALPRWLLTWLVCVALNLGLGEVLRVNSRWWLAALVLLLWCAALAMAERFGHFWAMLALWTAALGLCLLLSDRKQLTEAVLAAFSRSGAANAYGELVLLLLCASIALLLSALMRFYWARAALSLAWAALWITAALLEWPIPRLVPAALIPLLLLTLAETIRRFRRESEQNGPLRRALLLTLLPTALLLAVLPVSPEPYGYPLLHAVAEKAEQLWHEADTALHYRHKGVREFGLSFNGFSDEAAVGQRSEENEGRVVYAKPAQTPTGAVYLFGNAWNSFDGRGWASTLRPEAAKLLNWRLDTAERVYALWRMLDAEDMQQGFPHYFRTNNVYLSCRNMNVRTMFSVMNTTHVFTDAKRFPYADAATGSLFDFVQKEEVWYRVYYLESNGRTRKALIAASEGKSYDADAIGPLWYRVTQDFLGSFRLDLRDDVNLEKTFAEREALIRSAYLDCTGVSDRARALAEEITEDCGGDYEKICAIAAYLQENYSYALCPAPVPDGENLLDWLLFEGREGYCTWYATAAVLLSRSVGVPARYVQGYRGELTEDSFTALRSGDAHAWCECYIGGYGWVTVEATPGFAGEGVGWAADTEEQAPADGGNEPAGEPEEPADGEEAGNDEDLPPLPVPANQGDRGKRRASEAELEPVRFVWLPILISAVLLAAMLAVWLWLRMRRKRRYEMAEPSAKLRMDLELLLSDLRGKGYPRRPEESLRQYFARLPWRNLLTSEAEAEEMAALYDRTFFAQTAPSRAELLRHRAFAARFRPRTLRQWMIWHVLQR